MAKAYTFTDVPQPTGVTVTPVAGGSLVAGTTYYYRVQKVYTNSTGDVWCGKSLPSDEFTFTPDATNKTARISFTCANTNGSYRIFRQTSSANLAGGQYTSPITFHPKDSDYNTAGTVTFDDTGYTWTAGNSFYEWKDLSHGILTVSGSTSSNKFSITDLYNADVANGWGVVLKLDENTYKVNCHLICSTGQYWYDWEKTIIFADGLSQTGNWQLGNITSGVITSGGCNIIVKTSWLSGLNFGTLTAYRTTFIYKYPLSSAGADLNGNSLGLCGGGFNAGIMQDCTVDRMRGFTPYASSCVVRNCIFSRFDNLFNNSAATFDDVKLLSGSRIWQISGGNINIVARGIYSYSAYVALAIGSNATSSMTTIDSVIGLGFLINSSSTGLRWYDKISYNLTIVDETGTGISGANLKIYDKDGVELLSVDSNASGVVAEQLLTRRYQEISGTTALPFNNRYPFTVVVSKTGYETYTEKVTYLLSLAVIKTVALKPIVPIRLLAGDGASLALQPELGSSSLLKKI